MVQRRHIRTLTGYDRICETTLVQLPHESEPLLRFSFLDITDRTETERNLLQVSRALRALSRGSQAVVRSLDKAQLFRRICRIIVETGGYQMAGIGMVEHDTAKSVRFVSFFGTGADRVFPRLQVSWAETPAGRGTSGHAIRSGRPQMSQDLATDQSAAPWPWLVTDYGIAAVAAFPLRDEKEAFAVLVIYASKLNAFDAAELALLQELADDLAYGYRAIQHRQDAAATEKRWQAGLEATVGAIATTVEMRDPYTAGHQQRVANLAVSIARALGLPEHEVHGIYLASIIHDIGKISVPAEILSKPGLLSALEYALIQEHVEVGYNIIKGIDFPWPIAETIRQHHERIDGSGYPRGLKGEAISIEAKILAVADVVEAMMTHRPYRAGLGSEAALSEIETCKGRLFDPAVVDACITLFRHEGFRFDAEVR